MAVIPALERWRQKDQEFKVILGHFACQRPACTARNFLPNPKPNKIWKSLLKEGESCNRERDGTEM